jgi:hypothetical protein
MAWRPRIKTFLLLTPDIGRSSQRNKELSSSPRHSAAIFYEDLRSENLLAQIKRKSKRLEEIIRTNNAVELSVIDARLTEAGIEHVVLDGFTSGMEGSIGAIPRRVLVFSEDKAAALALIEDVLKGE